MGQPIVVMAFRARLCKLGYENVSIVRKKFIDQELYRVSGFDPLTHTYVERYMSLMDMFYWK